MTLRIMNDLKKRRRTGNYVSLCGTVCADNQGIVPGSTGPFRGGRVAESDPGVHGTLPSGTESPRARQPPHCSRDLFVGPWWTDPATAATGRDVELLSLGCLGVSTCEPSVRASVGDDCKDRCYPAIHYSCVIEECSTQTLRT